MKKNTLLWIGLVLAVLGVVSERRENWRWQKASALALHQLGYPGKKPENAGEFKIFLCEQCKAAKENPKMTNSLHLVHR